MTVVWLVAALAFAATGAEEEEAKHLYKIGSEAYRLGNYEAAIPAFERARRLVNKPVITFSLAQAYRLTYFVDGDLAKLDRALELYRAYLAEVPKGGRRDHAQQHLDEWTPVADRLHREPKGPAPGGPIEGKPSSDEKARTGKLVLASVTPRASARVDGGPPMPVPVAIDIPPGAHRVVVEAPEHVPKTLETVTVADNVVALEVKLDEEPGQVAVRAPEGAGISIDGRAVGVSPLPEPVELPPGKHLVTVADRGYAPFVQQLDVSRGQAMEIEAELQMSGQRFASYGMFVTAAALLAASGVTAVLALDRANAVAPLEERYLAGQQLGLTEAMDYKNLAAEHDTFARVAGVTSAIGATAAITGLILWLLDTPNVPKATVVAPAAGPVLGVTF